MLPWWFQSVKKPPAMQETWIWSLGQEEPLEKGIATTPLFLPGEFHGQKSLEGYNIWGHKELDTTEWQTLSLSHIHTHTHTHTHIYIYTHIYIWREKESTIGLPRWYRGKEPACQCRRGRRLGFDPWVRKSPGAGHGNPMQCSCLENLMDRGDCQATIHGVAKSHTGLK